MLRRVFCYSTCQAQRSGDWLDNFNPIVYIHIIFESRGLGSIAKPCGLKV